MTGYTKKRRRSRNLDIKKTFLIAPEQEQGIVALTQKYGNESQVMRVALDGLFLVEGVSITNLPSEQDELEQVPA